MRIVLTTAELGYRGTPRTLVNYARILRAQGHIVYCWGWREGGESVDVLRCEGFTVFVGLDALNEILLLRPDILNIHRPGLSHEVETKIMREFKGAGARIIETSIFGCVDRGAAGMIDTSLQISRWDLYQWSQWKGSLDIKGVFCPNPVNTQEFVRATPGVISEMRKAWNVGPDDFVFGRIGKTSWALLKDPLLEVLDANPKAHVVQVEDYSGSVPEEVVNHPRVHIQKRLRGAHELCAFYSACDVCISMCPIGESFGFVNAESMCCGTPVIALSTPLHCNAQSEMVANGVGGIVIAQPKYLPQAATMLIENPARRNAMAGAARELITKRYSMDVVAAILAKAFGPVSDGCGEKVSRAEFSKYLNNVVGKYPLGVWLLSRVLYTSIANRIITALRGSRGAVFENVKRLVLKMVRAS